MNFKTYFWLAIFFLSPFVLKAQVSSSFTPIVKSNVVFQETDGVVAVEAEHFYKQTASDVRQWYITETNSIPEDNIDPHHIAGASSNAYIEILPDTRATHGDKLVGGVNFSNEPGKLAVAHYKIHFEKTGRYYVWARVYSTGSEDNGIHVGIDGTWPEHGQRMQWCEGKNQWTWESRQRTKEKHCGVKHQIYIDVNEAGVHDIQFSLREDGFELDKFILTQDIDFVPSGEGVASVVKKGKLPKAFPKL